MKTKRTYLRLAAILALIALGGVMMVIGRGHTIYLDNQPLEYGGAVCKAPWQATVVVDGAETARLLAGERGMASCMGQRFRATVKVVWEEGGPEEQVDLAVSLPYNRDELLVNLPAWLAGLPQEAWLTPFVSAAPAAGQEDETVPEESDPDGL